MEKNITAEMETFFELFKDGMLNVEEESKELGLDVKEIELASEAWYAVKNGEKPSKKGVLCVGKVGEAIKTLL